MQVKALKTFAGRIGLVRAGMVITVDERYGKQLLRSNLVELVGAQSTDPATLTPDRNANLGDAPEQKDEDDEGNDEGDEGDPSEDPSDDSTETTDEASPDQDTGSEASSTAGRRTGGKVTRSPSPRQGRRSRKKT